MEAQENKIIDGIAIIGMAGRFPGANNISEFWENLKNGKESIKFFSEEELSSSEYNFEKIKNDPTYVKAKGILEGVGMFDAGFFGFTPRDASLLDPQHRIWLETAWEALEDASVVPENIPDLIGVFAGAFQNDYLLHSLLQTRDHIEQFVRGRVANFYGMISGNDNAFLPTRTSYLFNLKGPSINVQTTCSTSLVATVQACQSLLQYESDICIAGGVCVAIPQETGYFYQEGAICSPDGHCRPFDKNAEGTIFSNGVGVVILKRLEDAIENRDNILGVIRGSATNNDGSSKVSFMAPSIDGQAEAIAMAQNMADISAESISYIEAHGTATPLGDPIEFEGLKKAFGLTTDKKQFCGLGSVKSNIGHLDVAAGVTGLIKTTLALKNRQLPATLHYKEANSKINFSNSPFYVVDKLTEWAYGDKPLRAGVSSFGLGGTNAHVVVEEAPIRTNSSSSRPRQLLFLSAKSETALEEATGNLQKHISQNLDENIADVAYTQKVGRKYFKHRRFVISDTSAETTVSVLNSKPPHLSGTKKFDGDERDVIFLFPGQGSQYVNMGLNFYKDEAVFRGIIDKCSEILLPFIGKDMRDILYPKAEEMEEAERLLKDTYYTQPALFMVEYALAKLWMQWGMMPDGMMGHSLGEFVAACLADVFSLEDALEIIAHRARLMSSLPGGDMLSVKMGESELTGYLNSKVSIAAINGKNSCVASGPAEEISTLQEKLKKEGVLCKKLHVSHAFHSPMLDSIIEPFEQIMSKVKLSEPKIPFVSTVTAQWITNEQAIDPKYWAKHIRATVRFAEGVEKLWENPTRILLEVGPRTTASSLARKQAKNLREQIVFSSLSDTAENNIEWESILKAVGQLWLNGKTINWECFYEDETRNKLSLPSYPFQRKRYWVDPIKLDSTSENEPVELNYSDSQNNFENTEELNEADDFERTREDTIALAVRNILMDITGYAKEDVDYFTTFIEFGCDSLMMTQIALKLETQFKVKIKFRQLNREYPNIDQVSKYLDSQLPSEEEQSLDNSSEENSDDKEILNSDKPKINTTNTNSFSDYFTLKENKGAQNVGLKTQTYVLSNPNNSEVKLLKEVPSIEQQKEIWSSSKLDEDASRAYNLPVYLKFKGELEIGLLFRTIIELIQRHEALRLSFSPNGEKMNIFSSCDICVPFTDLSKYDLEEIVKARKEILKQEIYKVFNLETGPLFRLHLYKIGENEYELLMVFHHIIADGYSLGLVVEDFSKVFSSFKTEGKVTVEPADSYSEYAVSQEKYLESDEFKKTEKYWLDQFSEEPPVVNLPVDYARPPLRTYKAKTGFLELEPKLIQRLKNTSAKAKCSFASLIYTAFEIFLYRITGQNEIVMGTPAAGQPNSGNFNLLGHCVNFLPLRSKISHDLPYLEYLKKRALDLMEALDHQDYTYGRLLKSLNMHSDLSRVPLVPAVINIASAKNENCKFEGLEFQHEFPNSEFATFELFVHACVNNETPVLEWNYNCNLFKADTIERFMSIYHEILKGIADYPNNTISDLPYLPEFEKNLILNVWNDTNTPYPREKSIHELFDQQAQENPDALAVKCNGNVLTYKSLYEKSNQLANYLIKCGLVKGDFVGICLDRGLEEIIAILAILKTGGAYVPMDPSFPNDRLNYIIEDTGLSILLVKDMLFDNDDIKLISFDSDWPTISEESVENPGFDIASSDLAYIMYTSGSTGNPKGVCVPHQGVVRLVKNTNYLDFNHEKTYLHMANIAFDASTFEIWGPLLNGAKLVIMAQPKPTLEEIADVIRKDNVTTLWLTTGLFNLFVDQNPACLGSLSDLLTGGDTLSVPHALKALEILGENKLYNGYGPTENTTFTTCYAINEADDIKNVSPIGKPISNTSVYILDAMLKPVPIGVPGELYIGGDGLAIGYLNQDTLTKEKFISNPFKTGEKMYKTGDLSKWLPDGNIDFLGRNDNQIKIRGFRVELGEIESQIKQIGGIEDVIIQIRKDKLDKKFLIAVIKTQEKEEIIVPALKKSLSSKLPDYMVPSRFIILNIFPLNQNGKVNRKVLQDISLSENIESHDCVLPGTKTERAMSKLWEEILETKKISIEDNFFDLGGSSLHALKLISVIKTKFDVNLLFKTLYEKQTIKDLAEWIDLMGLKSGSAEDLQVEMNSKDTNYVEGEL